MDDGDLLDWDDDMPTGGSANANAQDDAEDFADDRSDVVSIGGGEDDMQALQAYHSSAPLTAAEMEAQKTAPPATDSKSTKPLSSPSTNQKQTNTANTANINPPAKLPAAFVAGAHTLPPKPMVATPGGSSFLNDKDSGTSARERPLPPDWEVKYQTRGNSRGEVYYFNTRTQESTWIRPVAANSSSPIATRLSPTLQRRTSISSSKDTRDMSYQERHYRPQDASPPSREVEGTRTGRGDDIHGSRRDDRSGRGTRDDSRVDRADASRSSRPAPSKQDLHRPQDPVTWRESALPRESDSPSPIPASLPMRPVPPVPGPPKRRGSSSPPHREARDMRDDPNRDGHGRSKREDPPRLSREDGSRSTRNEGRPPRDESHLIRDDSRGARDASHRSSTTHVNGTASPHLPRKPLPPQSQSLELSTRNARREREEPRPMREEQQHRLVRDGPQQPSSQDGLLQERGRYPPPPRGYQDDYPGSRGEDHRSSQRKDVGISILQRRDEPRQRTPPPPSSTFIPQHPPLPIPPIVPWSAMPKRCNLSRGAGQALLTGVLMSAVGARACLV